MCCARVTHLRLSGSSLSVFSSWWCIICPFGIGPLSSSQMTTANGLHASGSSVFIQLRGPSSLCCRTVTLPTGSHVTGRCPALNSVRGDMRKPSRPVFQGLLPFLKEVALDACPAALVLPNIRNLRCSFRHVVLHVVLPRGPSNARPQTTHKADVILRIVRHCTTTTKFASGSGTTAAVGVALGRNVVSVELVPATAASARTRIAAGPIRVQHG